MNIKYSEVDVEHASHYRYMAAKTHRMPYLYRLFSAKEPYNSGLFCGKRPANEGVL